MKKLKLAWIALISSVTILGYIQPARALEDSPKALVDQAWQIVHRQYVDRDFNQINWQAVRQDYLKRSYSSPQQAYIAVQEMLKPLEDPYTRFLPPSNIKDLVDKVSGEFIGVGLTVGVNALSDEWVVVEPLPGSPAAEQGIKKGDVVVSINGTRTPNIDPRKASQFIIGPVGSKVALSVRSGSKITDYELVREQLDLNPLTFKVLETAVGKVGYIQVPVFTTKSPKAMREAIETLETQQVTGYILDLRGNPGGVFEASVEMARMWLRPNRLISLVDQRGEIERHETTQKELTQKPLKVLIDEESASASEVLAAALQDNQRATLIGTQTFGKGVIQSLEALEDGSGIVITVAKYLTPKGQDINKIGITPDLVVSAVDGKSPEQSEPRQSENVARAEDRSETITSQQPRIDQQLQRALKELAQPMR
ncbi:MAG: S41 family peptidase [Cyanobacteria bacterium P01_A01_bin.17]